MINSYYDRILNIRTERDYCPEEEDKNYFRYEATDYDDLILLFNAYEIKKTDCLVDFGSGLGRIPFFFNYIFECCSKGIEHNNKLYNRSMDNLNAYREKLGVDKDIVKFFNINAIDYDIMPEDNIFYFFNPFSIRVFMKIVNNILLSVEKYDRIVDIILYYPDRDYIDFLDNMTPFFQILDLPIRQRIERDPREKFLVYRYSLKNSLDYLICNEGLGEISLTKIMIRQNFKIKK